jgi:putative transposase
MKFDPQRHYRTSRRLKGHDDSLAGVYFVTIVAFQREMLFGEIVSGEMRLNRRGEIVQEEWFVSANIRKELRLFPEEFVVMPNHIHGIVWIVELDNPITANKIVEINSHIGVTGQSPLRHDHPHGPAKKSLASFVAGFKSSVTKRMRDELNETGIWQRNYFACPEPVEGIALSAMTGNWMLFENTLKSIHKNGRQIRKIHLVAVESI